MKTRRKLLALFAALGGFVLLGAVIWGLSFSILPLQPVVAAGEPLTIEIVAGYNLVVDSNVTAASTEAPNVATVMGRFCNTGTTTLTGVQAFIGDFALKTPGIYPVRNSGDAAFQTQHPHLAAGFSYAFTHLVGTVGLGDATRLIGEAGELAPGQCSVQYWHFTYPSCENNEAPPCSGDPVWGSTNDPDDDLWLEFDMWATAEGGVSVDDTWRMTMRNEIRAMANKIEPNGSPGGYWFNLDTDTITINQVITSNGIRYELGNIRHGFDNDGDYNPDYNAWVQPVGDPSYDPGCFRLIGSYGVLTITHGAGQPDSVLYFEDQLYFTNLPPDNTGVTGNVHYVFKALVGPCETSLSPYQEVASGYDNEKFNGDYGVGPTPMGTAEPDVEIDKYGNYTVTAGSRITYTVDVDNNSTDAAGLPLSSMPLVVSDTIPVSTTFTGFYSSNPNVVIRYLTASGYTTTQPADLSTVLGIQWWLTDSLAAGATATISFSVLVDGSFPPVGTDPFIENCADVSFGGAAPFDEDCHTTLVEGPNSVGDYVWQDEDSDGVQDAGETGINGVSVRLYYSGTNELTYITTTETYNFSGSDGYYTFTNLPDGYYLVEVDGTDAQIPYGYNHTTADSYTVDLDAASASATGVSVDWADFGFGPVLRIEKTLISGDPAYEGDDVSYTIRLVNTRPGDGSGNVAQCRHWVWAGSETASSAIDPPTFYPPSNKAWINPEEGVGENDDVNTLADLGNNVQELGYTGFNIGVQAGNILTVDLFLYVEVLETLQAGDNLEAIVYLNDAGVTTMTYNYNGATDLTGVAGTHYVLSETLIRNWDWTDFQNDYTELALQGDKGSGNSPGDIGVDAVAYRITTDQQCGGPNDTISTLPLTDTYDAAFLQFVSADPTESSESTGGTSPYANTGVITWTNLGPLYAGQSKLVTVTFTALEPTNNTTDTITNTACSKGATYGNGRPVHDACDDAVHDLAPTGEIGNRIWRDTDQDGIGPVDTNGGTDTTEVGIYNVVVTLTADVTITIGGVEYAPGTEVTTTTDADGYYLFEGLRYSGNYTVTVATSTLPIGAGSYVNTFDRDDGTTSPNDETLEVLDHDSTTGGDKVLNADFGYYLPTLIDGTIWHDWDQSGTSTPDDGEEWLTNVTVTLYDSTGAVVGTTTTDANGYFQFIGNFNGTYTVTVTPGTGDMSTGTWTQSYDGDFPSTPHEYEVTVPTGGYGRSDYSYYQTGTAAVGDTVYADWNADGDQDSNEEGIKNVTVILYEDTDGNGVYDAGTDAYITEMATSITGWYKFTGLPAGDYVVVVDETDPDLPNDWVQTQDPDVAGVCSGANCDGQGHADDLTAGVYSETVDFGYDPRGYASIGDTVWKDDNANGLYDESTETGIPNITVWLEVDLNGDGTYTRIMTATTDADGKYLFDNLPAANYRVIVDTADSDLPTDSYGVTYAATTAVTVTVSLTESQQYLDADFGFGPPGAIGDTIFWDAYHQGEEDWDENGISGVTVNLYKDVNGDGFYTAGTDTWLQSDTTDVNGTYLFTGLMPGDYVVVVDTSTLPGSPSLTADPDSNGISCLDAGALDCDSQHGVTLLAGRTYLGADFGYDPTGVIGDYVWIDANRNGRQDDLEPAVEGVVVTVTNGTNTYTAVTNLDGEYFFDNLPDGVWTVTFQIPTNLTPTISNMNYVTQGIGSAGVLTTVGASATEITVTLGGGVVTQIDGETCTSCDLYVDQGLVLDGPNEIGGHVFFDFSGATEANDPYNSGTDTPYGGVRVYLYDSSGRVVGITETNASGVYTFTGLAAGENYTVSVYLASPAIRGLDLTASNYNPNYSYAPVTPNQYNHDFGFYGLIDFGDLPDTGYGTYVADEGPGHISGTLYLGNARDTESDGNPNGTASGDDGSGLDDEDGIVRNLSQTWQPGTTVDLTATVTGDNGYLMAWFDWDGDGTFADPNERVLIGDVSAGLNPFSVNIPADAAPGASINVRFRLYDKTEFNLMGPNGLATNGEVEDYQFPFSPTAVELIYFTATGQRDAIMLTWGTAQEIDTIGFYLYRSDLPDVLPAEALNEYLILSQSAGGLEGAEYEYVDTAAEVGKTYYYWLKDISLDGDALYGPVSAMPLRSVFLPFILSR